MANFGPSKTWTDGEVLSHTDLNAALLDIINNVTNNNLNADNIDETDDYTWSGVNSFTGGHSIKVLSNAAGSIVTGTTLEWDPADGGQMTDNSSGISIDFKLPDASDNQDVFASIAAICLDDAAGSEDGELSFRVAVGGTNTEKMTLSNSALTVTPAITASGGVSGSVTSSNVSITGGSISGITDLAIADGGTGASTASAARTNLGLAIGSDVQAYDAELQALSGLTPSDGNVIVGNGSTFVTESAGTARTSLGLGSIATQAADNVSISGGSLTGMTSYSGGTISGTTGTFSGDLTVATSALFVDASTGGDVGIGTTSIASGGTDTRNVTIHNSNSQATYFKLSNNATGTTNSDGFDLIAGADGQAYVYNRENAILNFATNSTIAAKILANGDFTVDTDTLFVDASADRVGINTSSPASELEISSGDGRTTLTINETTAFADDTVRAMVSFEGILDTDARGQYAYISAISTAGSYGAGELAFGVRKTSGGSIAELLRLADTGRVGVGLTAPLALFHTATGTANLSSVTSNTQAVFEHTAAAGSVSRVAIVGGSGSGYSVLDFGDTSGSNNGGITYNHGADSMEFATTNGTAKMHLSSDGELGVLTTSPYGLVDIAAAGRNAAGDISDVDDYALVIRCSSTTNEGNGIAFTNDDASVVGGSIIHIDKGSANTGDLAFFTRDSGGNVDEAMRIDSSQRLLINKTSATGYSGFATAAAVEIEANAQNVIQTYGITSGAVGFATRPSATHNYFACYFTQYDGSTTSNVGNISITSSATAYNTSSDYRLKENIVGITDGITRIKSLKPSRFNFIAEADRTVDGFVAHEVSDIVPEAITGAKDAVDDEGNPEYQGIDQSKLVPLLTAALQEAITKIETLETKVAALEAA